MGIGTHAHMHQAHSRSFFAIAGQELRTHPKGLVGTFHLNLHFLKQRGETRENPATFKQQQALADFVPLGFNHTCNGKMRLEPFEQFADRVLHRNQPVNIWIARTVCKVL